MPSSSAALKRPRSNETREDIIVACLKLFARQGFHNTSISDIAKGAGITKGAIYWHFENKEALFAAILENMRRNWQEVVQRHVEEVENPRDKIDQLFENFYLLLAQHPDCSLFLQRVSLETGGKYAVLLSEGFEGTADFIAAIFEKGKQDGIFRPDLESKLIAYTVICSLVGAQSQCLANKNLNLHEVVVEIKHSVLARALAPGQTISIKSSDSLHSLTS